MNKWTHLPLLVEHRLQQPFLSEQPADDARENFEYLWKEVQKYSFLD